MKSSRVTSDNPAGAGGSADKRGYQSQLRKHQAERTRDLIIDALAEQVWQEGLADFAVPKVAKRAGVATRTVYRYFPTREDLLEAVGEWLGKHAPEPPPPRGLDDLTRYVRELHAYFEAHPQLVDLQASPDLGREVQDRLRARRDEGSRAMLAAWMPDVADERERLHRFAPVRVLLGSRAWLQLTRELGLSSAEATEAVCRAIEVLTGPDRGGDRDA